MNRYTVVMVTDTSTSMEDYLRRINLHSLMEEPGGRARIIPVLIGVTKTAFLQNNGIYMDNVRDSVYKLK